MSYLQEPSPRHLICLCIVAAGSKRGLLKISPMPGEKTDINDGCVFSTDHIGACFDWPEGTDSQRQNILRDHIDYTKGLLWFIASDERVPLAIREDFSAYGYPRDEYVDHDHFSPQLYVREARRLVGGYVMRQQDCWDDVEKDDSIGLGSYGVDSHHVQRLVIDGQIYNEGTFFTIQRLMKFPIVLSYRRRLSVAISWCRFVSVQVMSPLALFVWSQCG